MLDRATGEVVAALRGLRPPEAFATLLRETATRHNRALLAVEAQGPGLVVLSRLRDSYANLFEHDLAAGRKLGWHTTTATRPVLVDEAIAALKGGHAVPRDADLISECSTLVLGPGGKIEAAGGAHDDRFVAFAIAWQAAQRSAAAGAAWGPFLDPPDPDGAEVQALIAEMCRLEREAREKIGREEEASRPPWWLR